MYMILQKKSVKFCFIPGSYPSGQSYLMSVQQPVPQQTTPYPPINTNMQQPPPTYYSQENKQPLAHNSNKHIF